MSLKSEGGWYWPKVLAGICNLSLRKQCMKQEPKKNGRVYRVVCSLDLPHEIVTVNCRTVTH